MKTRSIVFKKFCSQIDRRTGGETNKQAGSTENITVLTDVIITYTINLGFNMVDKIGLKVNRSLCTAWKAEGKITSLTSSKE